MATDRGISTAVDVSLALLLVSASVLLVGYHVAERETSDPTAGHQSHGAQVQGEFGPGSADRTTATLGTSTISVSYDVGAVTDEDAFSDPAVTTEQSYARTDHGSPLGMLADAAVASHQLDGEPVLAYADAYEEAIDWAIRHSLLGPDHSFYVVASWEPYDGAAINGTVTAGERPPETADVSSTTTTVDSGLPAVDEDRLAEEWADADEDWWRELVDDVIDELPNGNGDEEDPALGDSDGPDDPAYAAAGVVIGEAIVEGFFPPVESQHALESQGIDRALTLYHYESMVEAVGDYSFRSADTHPPLVRSAADAEDANRRVLYGQEGGYDVTDADALAEWIAADLPQAFEETFDAIDDEFDGDQREEAKLEAVVESLSNDEVTITIQTWED